MSNPYIPERSRVRVYVLLLPPNKRSRVRAYMLLLPPNYKLHKSIRDIPSHSTLNGLDRSSWRPYVCSRWPGSPSLSHSQNAGR